MQYFILQLHLEPQHKSKHVPSYWKFNDSFGEDTEYITEIRKQKLGWIDKYNHLTDLRILWELLKFEIGSYTQSYSKNKAKEINKRVIELEKKFKKAENVLNSNPSEEAKSHWESVKSELNKYYEYITQGVVVRSRAEWLGKRGQK